MKLTLLLILNAFSFLCHAQQNISVKKGIIKQNDVTIAEYDGKGSVFKTVYLGFFAPGSKDTIIAAHEEFFMAKNPLFAEVTAVLKAEFSNKDIKPFYVLNTGGKGNERFNAQVLFNDSVPVMIKAGKLDESAVELFRSRYSFDFDEFKDKVREVDDTIRNLNKIILQRNTRARVDYRMIRDKSLASVIDQTIEIIQDEKPLAVIVKKGFRGGMSPRATYEVYKEIDHPITVRGIRIENSPIAFCKAEASNIPGDIKVALTDVVTKNEINIKGSSFDAMEMSIVYALINNKLL